MANVDFKKGIQSTLLESSRVLGVLAEQTADIEKAAEILVMAYRQGKKMVLFGNGGSAVVTFVTPTDGLLLPKKGSHLRVLDEKFVNVGAVGNYSLGCVSQGGTLRLLERLDTDDH